MLLFLAGRATIDKPNCIGPVSISESGGDRGRGDDGGDDGSRDNSGGSVIVA